MTSAEEGRPVMWSWVRPTALAILATLTAGWILWASFACLVQMPDRRSAVWVERRFSVGMVEADILDRLGSPDESNRVEPTKFTPPGAKEVWKYHRYGPTVSAYFDEGGEVVCVAFTAESTHWLQLEDRP